MVLVGCDNLRRSWMVFACKNNLRLRIVFFFGVVLSLPFRLSPISCPGPPFSNPIAFSKSTSQRLALDNIHRKWAQSFARIDKNGLPSPEKSPSRGP